MDNPFAVLSEEIQPLREAYPEAVPANVNADDVIGINDAVSTSESGLLTDEEILAEFSSDQEAMEEEEKNRWSWGPRRMPQETYGKRSQIRNWCADFIQSVRERGSRGNQKPCTENRGIGRTKLQELPTTTEAAFFFWV